MGVANGIVLFDREMVQNTKERNRNVLLFYMRTRVYFSFHPNDRASFELRHTRLKPQANFLHLLTLMATNQTLHVAPLRSNSQTIYSWN